MARTLGRRTFLAGGAALALAGCSATDAPDPDAGATPTPSASPPSPTSGRPDWSGLADRLDGTLARPGSATYDRARLTENPRFDGARPLAVLSAASTADVAAGIRFAREHDLPVAVRSGGHCYAGWSAGAERLVVDVRPLREVTLTGAEAVVGAGASLVEVYDAVGRQGRGIAGGSCPTVGIAGLTLGGGVGVLTRAYGLTCDRLTAVTVVLADGRTVTATAEEEPDLFWALRGGGGGQAGIVTSLTFDTFAAPEISTAFLQWPLAAADVVIPRWAALVADADPRLWSTLKGLGGQTHSDGPVVEVAATWTGPAEAFDAALAGFLSRVPAPTVRTGRRRGYLDTMLAYAGCTDLSVAQCSTTAPTGRLTREAFAATSQVASTLLDADGFVTVKERLQAAQDSGLTEVGISLDALGGVAADMAADETAFVHRDALATVQYTATYDGAAGAAATRFVRGWREAMVPTWGNHAYVNYADPTLRDYRAAYWGGNAARLADVRRAYDPDGFFTQPQPW